jgi:thioesterase domain-containing protein
MQPVLDLAFAHTHFDSLLRAIPLAQAMRIALRAYDGESLTLAAPLQPNSNDKGCAFGGSLASLTTLAGWGVVALRLKSLGMNCEVYVQDSTIRYLAPVWGELVASARLAEGESWDAFFDTLTAHGRGRLRLDCRVPLEDGKDACTFAARFVAIHTSSSPAGLALPLPPLAGEGRDGGKQGF